MFRLSDSEAKRAGLKVPKSNKYGVRQDSLGKLGRTIDGFQFDSQKEANRYCELKIMQQGNRISGLGRQVPFRLEVNGELICTYRADFTYFIADKYIVEDVKGKRLGEYIIKRKLMKACHGILIREV